MAGENLETRLKAEPGFQRDIVEQFGIFSSLRENPNETFEIGGQKFVYGLQAFDSVMKLARTDEAKYWLTEFKKSVTVNYQQNGEFTPSSKRIFGVVSDTYNDLVFNARSRDILRISERYGFNSENAPRILRTGNSFKELMEQYESQLKDNKGKKNAAEKLAEAVVRPIIAINQYLERYSKDAVWKDTFNDCIKRWKEMGENPAKFAKG